MTLLSLITFVGTTLDAEFVGGQSVPNCVNGLKTVCVNIAKTQICSFTIFYIIWSKEWVFKKVTRLSNSICRFYKMLFMKL